MNNNNIRIIDGNEAAADVAYRTNEICVIYPITPASTMGELADQWSAEKKPNIWQMIPDVVEMQSEGGAAGAVHGALQTGALTTTFTASQGLLLMIPDMYHISAELTPCVFHVASRAVASHGMTIYCEHSDVMAVRATGFALLASSSVQEAHDIALIAQATSLKSKLPVLHFFDGFRTSHEVSKIEALTDDQIRALIDDQNIIDFRNRRMSSENPSVRGQIYNSDIYFQQREAVNPYYEKLPEIMQEEMNKFTQQTGREYKIIEYYGHPQAERVMILMASGAETARETAEYLVAQGEKVGVLQIRLFQPFSSKHLFQELPASCEAIVVLDRTKEPGAGGEPLYQKISTAILESYNTKTLPSKTVSKIIAGRYGIAGKEFNPAMVKAIFDELKKSEPKNHFTIGIDDDISHTSLNYDPSFNIEKENVFRAIFYGLGADGTVSANKNSIKIIGKQTDNYAQGYFIYDAKKSGSRTISHLRFGPDKIRSTYLIEFANFIGCHQFSFIKTSNVLENAAEHSIFLLNSPYAADKIWEQLSATMQNTIITKKINFYVIDAYKVASMAGLGNRINTIMQTCFFALTDILPTNKAIEEIKKAISKTYANKGEQIIQQNFAAVDSALANLKAVIPSKITKQFEQTNNKRSANFISGVIKELIADRGNNLPVSCFPHDGTYPTNTTKLEKRNVALLTPEWDPEKCIQCGKCSVVCSHTAIRAKKYTSEYITSAPKDFKSAKLRGKNSEDQHFTIQCYLEDCTGCGACVEACPVKDKAINLTEKNSRLEQERSNIKYFESIPETAQQEIDTSKINELQFAEPLFEFSGACAGCGETPYIKLLTQLYGDRLLIANACGCSSVFGGSMPTSPWTKNHYSHGPAWSSSLFENNAEFGFGFQLTEDQHKYQALTLLDDLKNIVGDQLVAKINNAEQNSISEINQQREHIAELKKILITSSNPKAKHLLSLADHLLKHSVWAVGGDGWAYDIDYGGLDHVIASGRNINILVLDTEVYSNTGGQASKASPRGSVVKFAANGKNKAKKDLGLMAMSYQDVYVGSIALGANAAHAIKVFKEAESYNGPSLIIAYSHCIAHGIDMRNGMKQQERAVKSGYWILYRYNPELAKQGHNPLQIDSPAPSIDFSEYRQHENRFQILARINPEHAAKLMELARQDAVERWNLYQQMAKKGV